MDYYFKEEKDWGNIEYKKAFIDMDMNKIKKYATQLKFRIIEGEGTALYIIGVSDKGNAIGILKSDIHRHNTIMNEIINEIDAVISSYKIINISENQVIIIYMVQNKFNLDDIAFLKG